MNLPTILQLQAAFAKWFNTLVAKPNQLPPTSQPLPGSVNRNVSAPDLTFAEVQEALGIGEIPATGIYTFKATLTQSGTDAPTVAGELVNTFPGLVAITRSSPGNYQVIFPAASNVDKISCLIGSVDGAGDQGAQCQVVAENTVAIVTYVPSTLAQEDDILSKTLIEINVYP